MIYTALIMTFAMLELPNKKPRFKWLPLGLTVHAIVTSVLVALPALAPQYSSPYAQFLCFHASFGALEGYLLYKAT